MVCHCGVLDGLPQPEAKILDPAIPLCPAKAMTPPKRRQLALQALAGAETVSYLASQHAVTYCYLLSLEDHRDADTWGVQLLEAQHQGFQPEATIADAGQGIRAGQALAMPTESKPERSPWPTTWPCCLRGCARTCYRWPVQIMPRVANCSTSSSPNSSLASRFVPIALGRWSVRWRISATICWPSPPGSIGIWRSWRQSSRSQRKRLATC